MSLFPYFLTSFPLPPREGGQNEIYTPLESGWYRVEDLEEDDEETVVLFSKNDEISHDLD